MENKLNFSAIESYAKAYSGKICDYLYQDKGIVDGDALLNLPVPQIGLFVLGNIYGQWQTEAEKLHSPYFNYEASEVKAAMKKLMNVLSKNISIGRDDLHPIMENATKETLILTLSPYTFFRQLVNDSSSNEKFVEASRFIRINNGLATEISRAIQVNGHGNLLDRFDEVFNDLDISPDNPEPIVRDLAKTQPVSETDFYLALAGDDDEDDDEFTPAMQSENTLNDSFIGSNHETVADTLKQHQTAKGSIKSMLSINQKFMFINDLFNDNQDDFNKVVDFIEGCETKEAAMSFISNNYLKHNIWNPNAPQVREFIRLIELQFE